MIINFNFSEPFWKYMFGINCTINDLHHIWDENTFTNYMNLWNVFYLSK